MDYPRDSLEKELEALLSESIESAKKREKNCFDELAGPFKNSVVLFGAGSLGKKVFAGLRKVGLEPLACCDNAPSRWGQFIDGIQQVLSPTAAAARYGNKAVFVVTIWNWGSSYAAIKEQLLGLGCSKVIPFPVLAWKYPEIFLPYYNIDLPHKFLEQQRSIIQAYNLLSDKESCDQYLAQLRLRLLSEPENLPPPAFNDQYFPDGIISLSSAEVFIDCGAFDGDTIRKFLSHQNYKFNKIIAFEPDPLNFRKLEHYVSRLPAHVKSKIDIYNYAVTGKSGKIFFSDTGAENASVIETGSLEVSGVALDGILLKDKPTFIKLDIEGSEMDALIGAQESIRQSRPIIAVCVYHRPFDLWELLLYLRSLYDGYQFFLRVHAYSGYDAVIYAIPQ